MAQSYACTALKCWHTNSKKCALSVAQNPNAKEARGLFKRPRPLISVFFNLLFEFFSANYGFLIFQLLVCRLFLEVPQMLHHLLQSGVRLT